VTNHDPCLKDTTNVEEYSFMFGDRMGNFTFFPYNNVYTNDYLIDDFSLTELKMLKRRMRYPTRNQFLNNEFSMMTLEEVIELMLSLN
jgi:hypothetical protein